MAAQVAEGVATAGVVVGFARKYRVSLPVLTAVAKILDDDFSPMEAVQEIMNLPQIEESQSSYPAQQVSEKKHTKRKHTEKKHEILVQK